MIIQHNMLMMNNCRIGKQLQIKKADIMEKLSSGYRINRAADDAAGLAISEKMNARIRSLNRCQNNIEEGISLAQTADGALNEVNAMLNRVSDLCVQAANDTNTTDDRAKIAEEITQIYDDMDRIFETTEFNTIPIFRHDGDNFYGPKAKYLYHEKITVLPPDDFSSWGAGAFPTKTFDMSKGAAKATATLTLDNSIDPNDATSMDGMSFTIKKGGTNQTFYFFENTSNISINNGTVISTKNRTVQQAFQDVAGSFSYYLDSATVNGNSVTFTFDTREISNTFTADGKTVVEKLQDGSDGNGYSILFNGTEVEITDSTANPVTYSDTITQDLFLWKGKASSALLTADDIQALKGNTIVLSSPEEIVLSSDIALDTLTTVGDLRQAIADEINSRNNYTASYDGSSETISVSMGNCSSTTKTFDSISEKNSASIYSETTTPVTFSVSQTVRADSETQAVFVVDIPAIADETTSYSITIDGYPYTIYNKNNYPEHNDAKHNNYYYATNSDGKFQDRIYSLIKSEFSSDFTFQMVNGKLEMTAKQLNDNTQPSITAQSTTLELIKNSPVDLISGSSFYEQEYTIPVNIQESVGNNFDVTALYGRGFMLNNTSYRFTGSGDSSTIDNTTTKILLDGVSDYTELCNRIADATGFSVTENTNQPGTLLLTGTRETYYYADSYYIHFIDGARSPFTGSVTSSGGTAYKNPQAEIDFSQYDMENLDELYGTGFRITCATCPGEFINVMFCHDKSELNYPDSFEYTDDQGNQNTIHNYMVELKDVTHASQIAANIADQLKNDLDHFTEVKVSDTNPSILIAQDKRSQDQNGRGQILAGVYTNFTYHVIPEKIPDMSELVDGGKKGTDAYYSYCMIYAADSAEKPYIAVHLPVFTVENLKLDYPDAGFETYEQITSILKQSRNAAEVVSMARSKIGADQNRLEHALSYAANAEEQLTAANSRLRDLDMAEGVTELAKLSLLSDVQQTLLSQLADQPERILSLLQQ